MLSYEQAKAIAISNTIPNGKVYYSGDAGSFYIFIVVEQNFPTNIKGALFGSTFTAVNKDDEKVWTCHVTDPRLKDVKKIGGGARV